MYAWLLVLILVGGIGGIGFGLGAIRSAASLVGALVGLAAAGPLGRLITPLFPKMGTEHPVWLLILPPLAAFAIIWLIGIGIGFALDRPVGLYFKYKTDDVTRKSYEAMSQAAGLFVGLITGVMLLFAVGKQAYYAGYLTTQTSADNEAAPVGILNQLRQDMQSSGWDRVFAAVDKTPAKFYQASDILGVLFHNPLIHGRAGNYPPFLALADKPEFKEIGADTELVKELSSSATFMGLSGNGKIQAVLHNPELTSSLLATDLADFRSYLETAKSPRYDDEKILGRWRIDPRTTVNATKRGRLNMTTAELRMFHAYMTNVLGSALLTAYVDGKLTLVVPPPPAPPKAEENQEAQAPAPGSPGYIDPALAQRYGRNFGRPPGAPPTAAAPPKPAAKPAPANPFMSLNLSRDGTWKRNADVYTISSAADADGALEATVNESGRLVIPVPSAKISLHFVRVL